MLEHFENPRNVGTLDKEASDVSSALETSGQCGLVVRAQLRFGLDGRVVECRWKTFGCGSLAGSMSWLSEWARGRALTELLAPPMALLTEQLALTGDRLHCGEFASTALRSAAEQALARLGALDEAALHTFVVGQLRPRLEAWVEDEAGARDAFEKKVREVVTSCRASGRELQWAKVEQALIDSLTGAATAVHERQAELRASRELEFEVEARVARGEHPSQAETVALDERRQARVLSLQSDTGALEALRALEHRVVEAIVRVGSSGAVLP